MKNTMSRVTTAIALIVLAAAVGGSGWEPPHTANSQPVWTRPSSYQQQISLADHTGASSNAWTHALEPHTSPWVTWASRSANDPWNIALSQGGPVPSFRGRALSGNVGWHRPLWSSTYRQASYPIPGAVVSRVVPAPPIPSVPKVGNSVYMRR